MKVAVFDRSDAQWSAGGYYTRVQVASLLLAAQIGHGVEVLLVSGQGRACAWQGIGDENRLARVVQGPGTPPLTLRQTLCNRVLGKMGLDWDPRRAKYRSWLRRHDLDVLLSFYPPEWFQPTLAAMCYWIPDFQHVYLPQYFSKELIAARNEDYCRIARQADVIICSGEQVKSDFTRLHSQYAQKARIFRFSSLLAFERKLPRPATDEVLARYGIEKEFLLVVNQFFAHKNHIQVIEALGLLAKKGRCPQVVMVGHFFDSRDKKGATLNHIHARIAELRLESRVKILGFVPSSERDALLRGCKAVLQPSEFEGWNTTVEDAKALGRPVIASDIPVHREQLVTPWAFFELGNTEQLAELIGKAMSELPPGPDFGMEESSLKVARTEALESSKSLVDICSEAMAIRNNRLGGPVRT